MTRRASHALRCTTVLLLVALLAGVSPAHAVGPPPIDDSLLPDAALPAPPQRTVQRETCAVPSLGPGAGGQLDGLDLQRVWQLTRGSGQRVAIIDTGVSPHPRLPETAAGGDYVFTGDGRQDCDGHGTAVAGIIAAAADSKPGGSSAGVAPEAIVISIRQSSSKFAPAGDRSRAAGGDGDTMAKAVRTAADLGASVINISSIACVPVDSGLDDRALGAALAYAVDVKNSVVVTAAGNSAGAARCPHQRSDATWQTTAVVASPAWYDDYVLTVGSVNADGMPSDFTLAGPWVDVAAPGEGVSVLGAQPVSGTSYAAAVVSGLAALIRSRFPAFTARQVTQRIESTAHHPPAGWDPLVGNGTIDALAAVSTDSSPPETTRPTTAPVPIVTPPSPTPPDRHGRDIALRGAAICLVALLGLLAAGRLRASGNRVAGD